MSWDYAINIYKNNQYLFTVAGHNASYDDIVYDEINKIINIDGLKELSKEKLIKTIENNSQYMRLLDTNKAIEDQGMIDIGKETIIVNGYQNLYKLEDVNNNFDDFEIISSDDENKWCYHDLETDELIVLPLVTLDENIVNKETLTFDEFKVVSNLYFELLEDYDYLGFILNNKYFLYFNTSF